MQIRVRRRGHEVFGAGGEQSVAEDREARRQTRPAYQEERKTRSVRNVSFYLIVTLKCLEYFH